MTVLVIAQFFINHYNTTDFASPLLN